MAIMERYWMDYDTPDGSVTEEMCPNCASGYDRCYECWHCPDCGMEYEGGEDDNPYYHCPCCDEPHNHEDGWSRCPRCRSHDD